MSVIWQNYRFAVDHLVMLRLAAAVFLAQNADRNGRWYHLPFYRRDHSGRTSHRADQCQKLMTAIIVALAIAMPTLKAYAAFQKKKMAAARKGGR